MERMSTAEATYRVRVDELRRGDTMRVPGTNAWVQVAEFYFVDDHLANIAWAGGSLLIRRWREVQIVGRVKLH